MERLNSSLKFWESGSTNINRNFTLESIAQPIINYLYDHKIICDEEYDTMSRNVNSSETFPNIDKHLKRNMVGIQTPQGKIFSIKRGVSKTSLCIVKERTSLITIRGIERPITSTAKLVIKYNRKTRKENNTAFYQQTWKQFNVYKSLMNTDEIKNSILPIFNGFKRYNAIVEPYVKDIGSVEYCCSITGENPKDFYRLMEKYNINDLHNENIGIHNGKTIVIDYGL